MLKIVNKLLTVSRQYKDVDPASVVFLFADSVVV